VKWKVIVSTVASALIGCPQDGLAEHAAEKTPDSSSGAPPDLVASLDCVSNGASQAP
jgi:hypothetical protein